MLADALFEQIHIMDTLRTADDLAIAFGRQQIGASYYFGRPSAGCI